jgi:hypothetical protein
MRKTEVEKSELAKLKELKWPNQTTNFSVIHVNTNGGMGGGNFTVIGEIAKRPNALGMVEVKLPVSKEVIQIHPSWISSVRTARVFHNGATGFLCELKSYRSKTFNDNSKCEIHCVEEWDSI